MPYRIKNWSKFQSFRKDRNAENCQFIKFYPRAFDNPEWHELSDSDKVNLLAIWSHCNRKTGILEISLKDVSFKTRRKPINIENLQHFIEEVETNAQPSGNQVVTAPHTGDRDRDRDRDRKLLVDSSFEERYKKNDKVVLGRFELITKDGEKWYPRKKQLDRWQEVYGDRLDIVKEFDALRTWHISNSDRMKTPRGMARSINYWLSQSYESAPKASVSTKEEDLSQY